METLIGLAGKVRNVRAAAGIGPGKSIRLQLVASSPEIARLLEEHRKLVCVSVRAEAMELLESIPEGIPAARGVASRGALARPGSGRGGRRRGASPGSRGPRNLEPEAWSTTGADRPGGLPGTRSRPSAIRLDS